MCFFFKEQKRNEELRRKRQLEDEGESLSKTCLKNIFLSFQYIDLINIQKLLKKNTGNNNTNLLTDMNY